MKGCRRCPRAGVLGVALPTVAAEFGATIEDVAWVTLAPGRGRVVLEIALPNRALNLV